MDEKREFYCWVCGCQVHTMKEIAQNMCDNCKASIIRKNKEDVPIEQFVAQMKKRDNSK